MKSFRATEMTVNIGFELVKKDEDDKGGTRFKGDGRKT